MAFSAMIFAGKILSDDYQRMNFFENTPFSKESAGIFKDDIIFLYEKENNCLFCQKEIKRGAMDIKNEGSYPKSPCFTARKDICL